MRWMVAVLMAFPALSGASACKSDDELFSAASGGDGASGADAGRGASEGAGEGGTGGSGGASTSLALVDNVRTWANTASAVGVYANVYQLFAIADGQADFADPTCPVTDDDGTTLSIEGGCTDTQGAEWLGAALVERTATGDRSLTLEDFGTRADGKTDTKRGTAEVRRIGAGSHDFEIDLVHESGMTTSFDYAGHVDGDYGERSVWTGSGTVTREGPLAPVGTVSVTTTDEVVDDEVCSGQPASGNTTIENDSGESVTVTYDGSVDCDDEQAANYSLNGMQQGQITGISCSIGRPSGAGQALPALLLLFAAVGARLRRSSSPVRGTRDA